MRNFIAAWVLLVTTSSDTLPEFPEATISNGLISARLYLPDSKVGYYRGSRFDWSGQISDLEYKDHTFFGQWNPEYNPTLHDAIMGPVDAFDPIGYDDAKAGETFLKIGIGTLIRSDDKPYHFATPYEIKDPGNWRAERKSDRILFTHEHIWKDIGYVYTKDVRLAPGKPELALIHKLKNTGSRPIETHVYNHNFLVIDKQPTGPDFSIVFPFKLTGKQERGEAFAGLQGNQIVYKQILQPDDTVLFVPLLGFGDTAADNKATIENKKTRAGVRISCNLPIARMVYWSSSTTVCPEPFSKITVAPGEEISWSNVYEFFVR